MFLVRVTWLTTFVAAVVATSALAVEKKPIQVNDRWSVVGVIAGGDADGKDIGIAVLKNNETRRTYTVSLGETLPTDYKFTLHAVIGRQVSVSDGEKTFVLNYAEADMDERDAASANIDSSRSSRFLDTYYRSFDGVPVEAPAAEMVERPGYNAPIQRFSTLREQAARSRFELFRSDRPYGADEEQAVDVEQLPDSEDGDGSFVVNYDNFVDDTNSDPSALGAWSDQEIGQGFEASEAIDGAITE